MAAYRCFQSIGNVSIRTELISKWRKLPLFGNTNMAAVRHVKRSIKIISCRLEITIWRYL